MESSESTQEIKDQSETAAKDYFDFIYDDIPEAFHSTCKNSKEQRDAVFKTGGSPVYGEMLYESVEEILKIFEATRDDIFMDLGSGSGKAPIQFTLLTGGKSIGIEFVPFRHELALQAREKLPPIFRSKVEFIQGDMFTYPIPAASIYMINACMFDEKYPEIATFLIKYGPPKFRVWSIGPYGLPFPQEYIQDFETKYFAAQWVPEEPTTLYWIEKN